MSDYNNDLTPEELLAQYEKEALESQGKSKSVGIFSSESPLVKKLKQVFNVKAGWNNLKSRNKKVAAVFLSVAALGGASAGGAYYFQEETKDYITFTVKSTEIVREKECYKETSTIYDGRTIVNGKNGGRVELAPSEIVLEDSCDVHKEYLIHTTDEGTLKNGTVYLQGKFQEDVETMQNQMKPGDYYWGYTVGKYTKTLLETGKIDLNRRF